MQDEGDLDYGEDDGDNEMAGIDLFAAFQSAETRSDDLVGEISTSSRGAADGTPPLLPPGGHPTPLEQQLEPLFPLAAKSSDGTRMGLKTSSITENKGLEEILDDLEESYKDVDPLAARRTHVADTGTLKPHQRRPRRWKSFWKTIQFWKSPTSIYDDSNVTIDDNNNNHNNHHHIRGREDITVAGAQNSANKNISSNSNRPYHHPADGDDDEGKAEDDGLDAILLAAPTAHRPLPIRQFSGLKMSSLNLSETAVNHHHWKRTNDKES